MPLAEKLGRMQPSPVNYNLGCKGCKTSHAPEALWVWMLVIGP